MKYNFSLRAPDNVSKSSIDIKPIIKAGLVVSCAVFVSSVANATIGTDSSASGFAGAQGKIWEVWEGIAPILGLTALGFGGASMIKGYSLATTGGILGVGGVVSAGPTIIETVSGTAIF